MKYFVGVDVGGMSIKAGVVAQDGKIICKKSVPTGVGRAYQEIIADMATLCKDVVLDAGLGINDIQGIGIGIPGLADSSTGKAVYVTNMFWKDVPLVEELKKHVDTRIVINNDANVATLAEAKFGSGKNAKNAIMLTLGTGVGGGIVIDGKICEGNGSAGAELGHTIICVDGEPCNCGRKGCFEAYASVTALINQTKAAVQNAPESIMFAEVGGDLSKISGKTAFAAAKKGDVVAQAVVDKYIRYVSEGVVNYINIFRPEVLIIGGGISAEGEYLLAPIKEFAAKYSYAGSFAPKVEIVCATLGNDAGIIGAAALLM